MAQHAVQMFDHLGGSRNGLRVRQLRRRRLSDADHGHPVGELWHATGHCGATGGAGRSLLQRDADQVKLARAAGAATVYTTTFIMRFRREWTGTASRWRGRVEHVQSGQHTNFLKVEGLLGFLEGFGFGAGHPPASRRANDRRPQGFGAGRTRRP
jgi:hypothetical protein